MKSSSFIRFKGLPEKDTKDTSEKGVGSNIWDRIRDRRAKGLPRLKPGQKGYPKTLDLPEDKPCWDTHKQVGMKKKNGKMVPNCVPKNEEKFDHRPHKAKLQGEPKPPNSDQRMYRFANLPVATPPKKLTPDERNKKLAKIGYKAQKEDLEETTYMRTDKKLPNLKVPVKRKSRNNTLAKRIKGEKVKGMIKDDMPANAAGHGGVAGIGVGPDGEPGVRMTRMTDKRRKKDRPPVLLKRFRAYESTECQDCLFDHTIMEAEYQGRKVKLNDPIRTSENPNKKFKVYTKGPNGNIVVVRFGQPVSKSDRTQGEIKRDDPKRLKSFRARHNCDNPGPKHKARYWSCFQWRAGAKVDN